PKRSFAVTLGLVSASAALWAALISIHVFTDAPMDSARASTSVKSRMKSVAAALLHLLQLVRPRLLINIAVALPGEIIFTCKKIGFAEALHSIVATDNRYSRQVYVFLRDALDYTTKRQRKAKSAVFVFAHLRSDRAFLFCACSRRPACHVVALRKRRSGATLRTAKRLQQL
ncbi:MAG: hypothetical protein DME83_08220, partial [Verrucomicrobia bacterium]